MDAIQEFADITELDAAILNLLIKEIVVRGHIDTDKTRHISIEIHVNLKPIPEVALVKGCPDHAGGLKQFHIFFDTPPAGLQDFAHRFRYTADIVFFTNKNDR